MKTQPRIFLRLAAIGLLIASCTFTQAQSELVFQDNFNLGVYTTDVNEGLATRQSGTAGVVSYLESDVTGSEGGLPEFTELYEGRLYLRVDYNTENQSSTWVSPNRNFVDGPTFTLEFKLDPSVLDLERTSDDWAAIVFGATATGQFVNASDGMGLLFRSNGAIQFFDGGSAVYSSEIATIPAGEVQVRIEVTGEGFTGTTPATVALFVNGNPVSLTAENATYTRATGFRANYLTLLGYAALGNEWQYTFDDLTVRADTCVRLDPQEIVLDAEPTGPIQIALKVPPTFNNSQGGTVTLSSSNPGVVTIVGAQDNQLAVNFTAGGPTSQIINLEVVGEGRARILMATDAPDCMGAPAVIMTPMVTTVLNPSFENSYNPAWPHYNTPAIGIDGWTGGSGANRADGPFHNGTIPDRAQIAFLQGANTISQLLTGLEPGKNYWLQVRYNARNCCGDFPDMTVSIDGTALGTESAIQAAGTYYFRNFEFTPTMDTALLEISGRPNAGGDATLLIDAVTVVQRDAGNVVVQNPGFEASGIVPLPGTFSGQNLSGWQGEGTFGLNLTGDPFADNGITPEGNLVAFIQGIGSLSQTLNGLIPSETYTVSFAYNARSGNQPHLLVTADDAVLLDVDVDPVGSASYHQASVSFVAQSGSAVLRFAQTAEGDQTVLFDDIRVVGAAINLPCIQLSPDQLQLSVGQTSSEVTVKVLEDVVANGPTTVTVTSTDPAVASLPGAVNGTLTLTFQLGGQLVQTVQVVGAAPGSARLLFSEPRGVCFDKSGINVLVLRGFVRNPSFEANSHSAFPGYGPIASWSSEGGGNTGINNATGPFHDNGVIPDRNQVALLQTSKIIRQDVVNLTPGSRYWLQFYYNVRNCCGGTIDLTVRFAGSDLQTFANIQPVLETNAYHFAQIEFIPSAANGQLEFETVAAGDATALLDALTIVQRDTGGILLRNPGFEASGLVPFPGYITNAIAGWDAGGGRGINVSGIGPFADNGANPDQDSVLFLQGAGTWVSQSLSGLTAGQNYTVRFGANARAGNQPSLKVSFDDYVAPTLAITPVGASNPYHALEVVVPATAEQGVLRFEQTAAGDHTVLIDNVVVVPGGTLPEPGVSLTVGKDSEGNVKLSWPASAADYLLKSANSLSDEWQNAPEPVVVEGDQRTVTVEASGNARFFRLSK